VDAFVLWVSNDEEIVMSGAVRIDQEQFEAWIGRALPRTALSPRGARDGRYKDSLIEQLWVTWQAALSSRSPVPELEIQELLDAAEQTLKWERSYRAINHLGAKRPDPFNRLHCAIEASSRVSSRDPQRRSRIVEETRIDEEARKAAAQIDDALNLGEGSCRAEEMAELITSAYAERTELLQEAVTMLDGGDANNLDDLGDKWVEWQKRAEKVLGGTK
jgi:hypothetical protein